MRARSLPCKLAGLIILLCPISVWSQDTAILSSSFNMAFGVSSDANTSITSTAGEVLVGPSEGENTRTQSGFLVVVLRRQAPLAVDEVAGLPSAYALHQNYPNPFNPVTTLRFDLPEAADVLIVIYDMLGREVIKLKQEQLGAGYHQVLWNGRDQAGRDLASGIYFTRLVTPEYTKSIKMLLMR